MINAPSMHRSTRPPPPPSRSKLAGFLLPIRGTLNLCLFVGTLRYAIRIGSDNENGLGGGCRRFEGPSGRPTRHGQGTSRRVVRASPLCSAHSRDNRCNPEGGGDPTSAWLHRRRHHWQRP